MSSPFHLAFPVHDLEAARGFYCDVLGCRIGRESERWIDPYVKGEPLPDGQKRAPKRETSE